MKFREDHPGALPLFAVRERSITALGPSSSPSAGSRLVYLDGEPG